MNSENETAKALKKPQEEKLHFLDSIEFNKKFIEQVFPEENQIADPAIYENSDVLSVTKNRFTREINGFDKNQNNTSVCLFSLGLNYLNKELFWSTIYGGQTKTHNAQQCIALPKVLEFWATTGSRKERYTKLAKTAVNDKENLLVLLNHSLLSFRSFMVFVGNFISRINSFFSQQNRRPFGVTVGNNIETPHGIQEPNIVAEVVLGDDGTIEEHVIENTEPDAGPGERVTNNDEVLLLQGLEAGASLLEICYGPQVFDRLGSLNVSSPPIVIMQLLHINQALIDFIRAAVCGTTYERCTLKVTLAYLLERRYLTFVNQAQPDGTLLQVLARNPNPLGATYDPDEEVVNAEEIVIEAVDTPEVHDVVGEAIGDAIADIADYDEEDEDYDEEDDDNEEDDNAVDANNEDRVVENIIIDVLENPIPVEHMEIPQQVVGDQIHEPAQIGHINVPNETLNTDGALPDWFLARFPDFRTPTNPTGYIDPPELVNELLHAQLTDAPRTQETTIVGANLLELYFGDDICNYMRTHTYITADTGEVARGLNTLTNVIAFIRRYAHDHALPTNTSFLSVLLTMLNTNELRLKMYLSERLHTICYTIQRATTTYGEVTDETQPDVPQYITDEELQRIPHIDLVAVQDLVRHIGTEYYQQTHPPFVEDDTDRENNTRG